MPAQPPTPSASDTPNPASARRPAPGDSSPVATARQGGSDAPRGATRDWRSLPQQTKRTANSKSALAYQRERQLRTWGVVVGIAVAVVGLISLAVLARSHYSQVGAEQNQTLENIAYTTDGVLPQAWLESVLQQPVGTRLGALDLAAMRAALLREGQIASAVVALVYPNTLQVQITERTPILRARTRGEDGRPLDLLVSAEGTVYLGHGYPAAQLAQLPWVGGVRLQPQADGQFAPLPEVERVAPLLTLARTTEPTLFATWRVVDLARLGAAAGATAEVVTIQTRDQHRYVLAPKDYEGQLARLSRSLAEAQRRSLRLASVDVSYGGQAIIQEARGTTGGTSWSGNAAPARRTSSASSAQPRRTR